jgi:hypothetical protein
MITSSFEFFDFSEEMGDNWAGNWVTSANGGWNLNLSFVGENIDLYNSLPTSRVLSRVQAVPEPATLLVFLCGSIMLLWRKKSKKTAL